MMIMSRSFVKIALLREYNQQLAVLQPKY